MNSRNTDRTPFYFDIERGRFKAMVWGIVLAIALVPSGLSIWYLFFRMPSLQIGSERLARSTDLSDKVIGNSEQFAIVSGPFREQYESIDGYLKANLDRTLSSKWDPSGHLNPADVQWSVLDAFNDEWLTSEFYLEGESQALVRILTKQHPQTKFEMQSDECRIANFTQIEFAAKLDPDAVKQWVKRRKYVFVLYPTTQGETILKANTNSITQEITDQIANQGFVVVSAPIRGCNNGLKPYIAFLAFRNK